jgi:hypothetical protein
MKGMYKLRDLATPIVYMALTVAGCDSSTHSYTAKPETPPVQNVSSGGEDSNDLVRRLDILTKDIRELERWSVERKELVELVAQCCMDSLESRQK